ADSSGQIVSGSRAPIDGLLDRYQLEFENLQPGEQYRLRFAGVEDSCGRIMVANHLEFDVTPIPNTQGSCPFPAPYGHHFAESETCAVRTNGTLETAAHTGAWLWDEGDAFTLTGRIQAGELNGNTRDHFAFDLISDGLSIYLIDVTLLYGCEYNGLGDPNGYPLVEFFNADTGALLGRFEGDYYYSLGATGAFGIGGRTVGVWPADNPYGANRVVVAIDPLSDGGWCTDYALFVKLDQVN